MAQWTKALELMQEVMGSNPGLDKFFYIFFLQKQIANPCSEKRETPVQITGKPCLKYRETMLGLQGNPCLDYRDFAVQGLYRASLYVHASYRVESEHRDSLFKLQGKN